MLDDKRLSEIEERVKVWAKEVNPQRRVDAMDLIAEVRRLCEALAAERMRLILNLKSVPYPEDAVTPSDRRLLAAYCRSIARMMETP